MQSVIIFLCDVSENVRERLGYSNAFKKLGYSIVYCNNDKQLKEILYKYIGDAICVIHPDPNNSIHSINLWNTEIPNVIFQFDTYTIPQKRILASRPYDIQAISHPDFISQYKKNQCEHVLILPHCIDDLLLVSVKQNKIFERQYCIGWIGRNDASFYSERRSVLAFLKNCNYKMNDTESYYSWEKMFEVYLQSKIVINVSRDDYSKDANLRCFEAMGCGALLITKKPSELEQLGFVNGVHFVYYSNLIELKNKIDYYLDHENERIVIARNGESLVLQDYTYLYRATEIIKYIREKGTEIIKDNFFRTLSLQQKYFYLAFSYFKDENIKGLYECKAQVHTFNKMCVIFMILKIKLKMLKKRILSS